MKRRSFRIRWRTKLAVLLSLSFCIGTLTLIQKQHNRITRLDTSKSSHPLPKPKIAFLFIARNRLPLDVMWDAFFKEQEEAKFSIYVHSRPGFLFNQATTKSRYFYGRQVNNSIQVDWGEASMIIAERILLHNALKDATNERFAFLSDSCIPLYNFSYTYEYIMSTPTSFVDSFADTKEGRYNPKMHPVIPMHNWRKGSQWAVLIRKHAEIIVNDSTVFPEFQKHCRWLKWHPKGHLILAGSEDSSVWLWNADKSISLNTFYGHASSVTCGDFSPDGKIICTGSDDASLRIWNPKTGDSINVRGHPYHTDGLTCLSITHDSTIALTGSKDSSVHMVNLATGRVISSLISHSDSVECLGISPSSHWAATGSLDQKLIIWDAERSFPRCTCEHDDGVTCLLWLGASRYVATGSIDGKVRIWDSLSGSCARVFSGHVDVVQSLAVTADLSSLVSVSNDGTARVFSVSEFR